MTARIFDVIDEQRDDLADMVIVGVAEALGEITASVMWPDKIGEGKAVGSDQIDRSMTVPEAIAVADFVAQRHQFARVVVSIEHIGHWRPEWGRLRWQDKEWDGTEVKPIAEAQTGFVLKARRQED